MSNIKVSGSLGGAGAFTVTPPAGGAVDRTLTLPDRTASLASDGPALLVTNSATQSLATSSNVKVVLNSEQFDTANAFDNATNYRFTPLVAGYYQVSVSVCISASAVVSTNQVFVYKNGAQFATNIIINAGIATNYTPTLSLVLPMNGSTDYLEMFAFQNTGASQTIQAGMTNGTFFSAVFVRAL